MKLKNVISTAAAVVALSASGVLASDLTVVSWGGGLYSVPAKGLR